MTHQYEVSGITCGGCISNVTKALEAVPGVTAVRVQKESPQATVTMSGHIPTEQLAEAVKAYVNYILTEAVPGKSN